MSKVLNYSCGFVIMIRDIVGNCGPGGSTLALMILWMLRTQKPFDVATKIAVTDHFLKPFVVGLVPINS